MARVNCYNCKNASGTTLTDSCGTNNGTLAGASLPSINANGYLYFNGGNGSTRGDRQRVELNKTDFSYVYNSGFTWIVLFRSTKLDAVIHSILAMRDITDYIGLIQIAILANETLEDYLWASSNKTCNDSTTINVCDGKWHCIILKYTTNALVTMLDGKLLSVVNGGIASGNFYTANARATIGAQYNYTDGLWGYDYKGDVGRVENNNNAWSVGEMKTYDAYLRGCL